jgi:pimeloyl-ACP methyl ester carboxylesterase
MAKVKLNGHPTWVTMGKNKKKFKKRPRVVLLHGGMSSSASMLGSIGPRLERRYRVAAFDRRGHGRTRDTNEPFHYNMMANETIAFLERLGKPAHLVGDSDGGIVALIVAMRRPDLVKRVVAVGANYHYSGLNQVDEFDVTTREFARWAKKYGRLSPDGRRHAAIVAEKARVLFATEPILRTSNLASIRVPILVMAGDDDVVALSHTCSLYESLLDAQLAIVPGSSHSVLKERPKECARIIRRFLDSTLPPVTRHPIRRD